MIYDLDSHTDAPGSVAEAGWHKALAFVQYHADLTQAEQLRLIIRLTLAHGSAYRLNNFQLAGFSYHLIPDERQSFRKS